MSAISRSGTGGTIGGTLCHADPAGDIPATTAALDSEFKVAGPAKELVISAKDFFQDILTTSLRKNEILTEVRVPFLPPRSGGAYVKLGRGSSDLAIVGVAASVTLDKAGVEPGLHETAYYFYPYADLPDDKKRAMAHNNYGSQVHVAVVGWT